ncbi:putative transporter [Leptomonas pyrrhocoris]|uniref:Putative transporter n=1 Tax=Leptomonas pyrrhocoris TaxID=157538 RepID=A0A0N0DXA6_LEPPY|nr:putative transporter [Leptomonas pyrrhocoris]XP_015661170.1 putative transporter [Leptomonas pyrrhocoris]KPA82730.1 putative transporter [Leptomonas pyrrhocoris]KPA82731.1 putative transporter [Leptomonas pyrrhocoris]|eukprot:XP_015661169.1 putative transporter [Leptomonas pyrrhocoris]
MNLYVGLMIVTATTVGKIMLCAIAGMLVSRYFSNPEPSKKGLSYIAMKIFLPCLLFTNLCLNVTWEQLGKFYWAPLFSCLPMALGFLCSFIVRVFLTRDYRYVLLLGSTFQNGLTFPVSILLNLKGIEWFTGQAVVDAESYIFLYNILCSIGLWAVGDTMIGWAKGKEVAEAEAEKEKLEMARRREHYRAMGASGEALAYQNRSFSYPFESPRTEPEEEDEALASPMSPRTAAERRDATAREQLGWYRPARRQDRPIVPPEGSPVIMLDGEMNIEDVTEVRPSGGEKARRMAHTVIKSLKSPPVLSSLIALFISLTPPLRWLAQSFLGESLIGGMKLIGEGAIPLQLLVLGLTIVASRPPDEEDTGKNPPAAPTPATASATAAPAVAAASNPISPNTVAPPATAITSAPAADSANAHVDDDANACVQWITTKVSPQVIFTWSTVTLRLTVIPAICFGVLHVLVRTGLMPNERPFLLSMLVASCSPSAINSSLICAMHGYRAREYSRMIFCMYVSAIFSSTIWLFLYILYLTEASS